MTSARPSPLTSPAPETLKPERSPRAIPPLPKPPGPAAATAAGVDRNLLRRLMPGGAAADAPDWVAVQASLDAALAGSIYLLAVLSDDLYATRADLWLWAAVPGPARPVRRRILLGHTEQRVN